MLGLFKKRWAQSETCVKATRAAMKLEIAGIEKKFTQASDMMVTSDNKTVRSAFERKIDELERQK